MCKATEVDQLEVFILQRTRQLCKQFRQFDLSFKRKIENALVGRDFEDFLMEGVRLFKITIFVTKKQFHKQFLP